MAAEVSSASPAGWQPRRRTRPQLTQKLRYSRDQLLALAPKASFPTAVLRTAPEVLASTPVAAILSESSPIELSCTVMSTPIKLASPLLRRQNLSPASPSSPLSASSTSTSPLKQRKVETDEHRLSQRTKQVEYGKRTLGYQNYIAQVPLKRRGTTDPRTPDVSQKCSKRSWDGQVRKWRRLLHAYDESDSSGSSVEACGSIDSVESGDEGESSINNSCTTADASLSNSASSLSPADDAPLAVCLQQLSLAPLSVEVAAH